jgi:predicted MFS family arabinose efflux permease
VGLVLLGLTVAMVVALVFGFVLDLLSGLVAGLVALLLLAALWIVVPLRLVGSDRETEPYR